MTAETTAPSVLPAAGGCNTHCPHGGECSLEPGHETDHQAKTAGGRVRCTWPRQVPAASSGCETADLIICADEARPGDLMVFRGVLCSVEAIEENLSLPAFTGIRLSGGSLPGGAYTTWPLRHHLEAVRRYVTTEG
jgi:hypothetical protein